MRTGESYTSDLCAERFDAIIIGSGISGLCTAAMLAQHGKRVLVLEKHFKVGGFTHTFRRKEYTWDVGIHYIGGVHRKRSISRRLFDRISDSKLQWAQMDDTYDRIIFPDQSYDLTAPKAQFIENLSGYFPDDIDAVLQYVDLIGKVARAGIGFFAAKAFSGMLETVTYSLMSRKFLSFSSRSTKQVIGELTANPRLLGVLTGQWGDYGLPPASSSFGMHALLARHFMDGANYPVGGAGRIAETIVPVIEEGGGRVVVSAAVDEIIVRRQKAVGVRMANGDEIAAPAVISSAGVMNTYRMFLRNAALSDAFRPPLETVRSSSGHMCLHVGLKQSAETLGLETTNLWVYPGYNHDRNVSRYLEDPEKDLPIVFISFPSAKDPTWEQEHPNTATIEAISLAPYTWFEKWQDRPWKKRGEDYEYFKQALASRLLQAVEKHVPAVRGRIDYYELSTPLSTRELANYSLGELYGLDHSPARFQQRWLQPRTPIDDLYLTGQDVITAGVTGGLMAGLLTASVVLKRNLLSDL